MLTRIQQISKFHDRTKKLGLFFLEFLVQAEADQFGTSFFFYGGQGQGHEVSLQNKLDVV